MAASNNGASAHLLTDVVLNFGTAYATTQEPLQSNATNIAAIQGQLQMLCQAVSTGSNNTPRMDAAGAKNAAKTMAAATVATVSTVVATTMAVVVAATAMAVAATVAVAGVAMQTAVVVAMAATMATAVATGAIRPQAAPHQQSDTRSGTTASPMEVTLTTTTPVLHVLAQVRTTNVRQYAPILWAETCAT